MKALRRLMLLGSFAAVGVGLAICVGSSTTPPANRQESAPLKPAVASPGPKKTSEESLWQPEAQTTWPVPPRPIATPPSGPLVVEPYPALTQQMIPGMAKQRWDQLYDALQRQLGGQPVTGGGNTTAGEAGQLPAANAAGQPPSAPASPVAKTTVGSRRDGKMAIHIPPGTDIRDVLDLLGEQANLNILAGKSVQGTVSATLSDVDIESALDAILKSTGYVARREGDFVFVGTPADFDSIEQAMDRIGTRVYRPNYVTAAELQALITPLLTTTTGVVSVSTPAEVGIGSDDSVVGGDAFAGAEVVVVRDYEAVLTQIDQMVREVDVRPSQVAIEAMILSVKLNDTNKFGVSFELLRNNSNVKFGWGTPADSLANVKFDESGLKFGFLDSSLGAFLEALESIGDTNVIATPRVMVLNKHRAEIQIGEKQGYLSTTITETSSTQSVEFLDIGAQLRLRPFISSDGLIRMEIHPELSDGSVDTESGFTLPNKEVTQVTTNVMIRDGCTLIIGGLMREQLTNTTSQIPLFGSLPLVGIAFRNTTETIERREVLVLITPHIVYEPETCQRGEKAACEFHRRQDLYADKMSCFGKRSIARRYFRLAQNTWAAGDRDTALRFAEMSVHFDPTNRAAIDLRSDIWLGKPFGEHTLGADAPPVGIPSSMDGETIAGWLLNDLQQEPVPQPPPLHPLDPGQPGPHTDLVRPRRLQ